MHKYEANNYNEAFIVVFIVASTIILLWLFTGYVII